MSSSITLTDLNNIVRNSTGSVLVNSTDIGGGFDTSFSGSESTSYPADALAQCSIPNYRMTANIDPTSLNIPPIGAQITKIIIKINTSILYSANATKLTNPVPNTSNIHASGQYLLYLHDPLAVINNWMTDPDPLLLNYIADDESFTTPTAFVGDSINTIWEETFDFTLNPNGDFPAGYCDYDTFLLRFMSVVYIVHASSNALAGPIGSASGTYTADASLVLGTTLWRMDITWTMPWSWTVGINGPNIEINSPDEPDLLTVEEVIIDYTVGAIEKRIRIVTSKFTDWTSSLIVCPIPGTCDTLATFTVSVVIESVEYVVETVEIE